MPGAEDGAALQVVGSDVGEPLPKVADVDGGRAPPFAGGLRRGDREQDGQHRRHERPHGGIHATSIRPTICRLAMTIDFR